MNCKHSTLHVNGNVVKGKFLLYKTECKLCNLVCDWLRGKHQGLPPGMLVFVWHLSLDS